VNTAPSIISGGWETAGFQLFFITWSYGEAIKAGADARRATEVDSSGQVALNGFTISVSQ